MAGKSKRDEYPPPVMPFDGEVDAVEPAAVEYVEPNVESFDVDVVNVDVVAPVFSPDDDPQPEPVAEPEPAKSSKASK